MANRFAQFGIEDTAPRANRFAQFTDTPEEANDNAPKDFAARQAADSAKLQNQVNDSMNRFNSGQQGKIATAFQTYGSGVQKGVDTIGNVAGSAARYAHDLVPASIDNAVSESWDKTKDYLRDTDFGKGAVALNAGMGNLMQKGAQIAGDNPVAANNLRAGLQIAGAAPAGGMAGTVLKEGAEILPQMAKAAIKAPGQGASNLLDALANAKAMKTLRTQLPRDTSGIASNVQQLKNAGIGDVSLAEGDPSGRAAALATALAKNSKAAPKVAEMLKERQTNLNKIYDEKVTPLYNEVNATPLPPAPAANPGMLGISKSGPTPFENLLESNPAISSAVKQVQFNMGEKAPKDTMALLLKARREVGSNFDARDAINKFITDNGGDIMTPDSLHKALKGTYSSAKKGGDGIISPQVALNRIRAGITKGMTKGDDIAIKGVSRSKIAAVPANILGAIKGANPFTSYAPKALETMTMDKRGQEALVRLLLGNNGANKLGSIK